MEDDRLFPLELADLNDLTETMKTLKLKKAFLVTAQKEETLSVDKMEIEIVSLWHWLLEK